MKKILSLMLVLVMLFSAVTMTLVSCGEDPVDEKLPSNENNPSNNQTEVIEGDIFSERAAIDDEIPENDFNKKQFRIVTHVDHEYFVPEDNRNKGDLIADAKYARNKSVEDRFNCEIVTTYKAEYDEVIAWVAKSVLSGVDEFDLYLLHTASANESVLKNLFLNWYDIPHIDFSKPWWSSCCADELTYDGKCILALSDFNYSAIHATEAIFFNKNYAAAYDMGNLYDVVLNGDWTFDYFTNLVKDVYMDVDGDGDKSEGDFYGFAQAHRWHCDDNAWLYAFDNPTTSKDEDGVPQISVKTNKINNIINDLYDFLFDAKGVHYIIADDSPPAQGMDLFVNRQAIFAMGCIGNPTDASLRNFEDDYGLLPIPKWDENQKEYYTFSPGSHTCMAVPKTVKDTEFVGTVIEALSAESYKQVIPTLYEIALKTRYLRDNESKQVLDIIIDGRMYDFGYIYAGFEGYGFLISGMFHEENNNFESYYAKTYNKKKVTHKKILRVFDKLD